LNRKIVVLNVVLAAVVVFAGLQLRNQWRAAKSREAATLHAAPVKAAAVPPYTPLPAGEAVLSAGYNAIAQKDLFDASRNPNVEIPAPPPPPPPPPMPALPHYYGQMNLDGVTAILSEAANSPQKSVKPGETIGQFKLVDVSIQEIVFEWNGQPVRKRLDELMDRNSQSSKAPVVSASTPPTTPPPPPPAIKTQTGPGELAPQGYKVCNPNDSTPDGAVVDGFRKVSYSTPFGSACRWDPIGK
jgi:hypothetical protein